MDASYIPSAIATFQLPEFYPYPSVQPPPHSHIELQLASQLSHLTFPVRTVELPQSDDIRALKSALDVLAHSCVACWLLQRQPEHDHLLKDCCYKPNPITTEFSDWSAWYQHIVLPKGFCYGCGCPQHVRHYTHSLMQFMTLVFSGLFYRH